MEIEYNVYNYQDVCCFDISCAVVIRLYQEYAKIACSKTHPCGHPCGGVKNEEHCLPCLHGCDKNATTLKQDADDMCMICFTEALSAAPAIQVVSASNVVNASRLLSSVENVPLIPTSLLKRKFCLLGSVYILCV